MVGTYASAVLISIAAVLIGRAICVLAGPAEPRWLAPPVGFAALMVVCEVSISLPGRGWTAASVVAVLCAASAFLVIRRRAGIPPLLDAIPVAIAVLVATSIPFLASGRVGVLGISYLNDTHWHLILAEGLLHPSIKPLDGYGAGYPLGPHAVAATFAQGLGTGVDKSLTGVLMAAPVLTGLAALGALGGISRSRRWLVAVLAAIAYLAIASYAESAFKEPILSLMLLGLVLVLQAGMRTRFARPVELLVPSAVLLAGVVYDYSYPGLLWPVGLLACWAVLQLVIGGSGRRLRAVRSGLAGAGPAFAIGAGLLVLLVAPDLNRIHTFWLSAGGTSVGTQGGVTSSALANLVGPLRSLEGLNIWQYGDFRVPPPDALQAGALAGAALILLLFAVVSALQRGELVWPSAILAFTLIYIYTVHSQSPYVASKALAIPAPLVVLGSGAALLRPLEGASWRSFATLAIAAGAVAYCFLALDSDYLVLRDAQVGPVNHFNELRSLRPLLHDRPTLVLFYDDYVQWELLGVPVSSPLLGYSIPAPVQPAKPWTYGQALDFDSVDAATLDRFDYVITTRTHAQSQPPPNFHLIGTSRSYEVWQRVGPTPPHLVLPESGQPGAMLNCQTAIGRRISDERGYALVRSAPLYVSVAPMEPGQTERVKLSLPTGTWQLSLPFVSPQAVTVHGAGLNAWLPPNLDRAGSIWPVGTVVSTGAPVTLTLRMADPGLISSSTPPDQFFAPEPMVAVAPTPDRTIPLHDACGRYVDWYTVG